MRLAFAIQERREPKRWAGARTPSINLHTNSKIWKLNLSEKRKCRGVSGTATPQEQLRETAAWRFPCFIEEINYERRLLLIVIAMLGLQRKPFKRPVPSDARLSLSTATSNSLIEKAICRPRLRRGSAQDAIIISST